jgi:hypothetical protein
LFVIDNQRAAGNHHSHHPILPAGIKANFSGRNFSTKTQQ